MTFTGHNMHPAWPFGPVSNAKRTVSAVCPVQACALPDLPLFPSWGLRSSGFPFLVENATEVQSLRSTGVTPLLHYYRLLRLPFGRSQVMDSLPPRPPATSLAARTPSRVSRDSVNSLEARLPQSPRPVPTSASVRFFLAGQRVSSLSEA